MTDNTFMNPKALDNTIAYQEMDVIPANQAKYQEVLQTTHDAIMMIRTSTTQDDNIVLTPVQAEAIITALQCSDGPLNSALFADAFNLRKLKELREDRRWFIGAKLFKMFKKK
jgi:hypothetical protein